MAARPPRDPRLRAYVERVWATSGPLGLREGERMLPSGRVHLALRTCATPLAIDGVRFGPAVIGGLRTGAYVRTSPLVGDRAGARVRSVGVVLAPGAALALLGIPAGALRGRHVELDAVWGARAGALLDALAEHEGDDEAALAQLEDQLWARLGSGRELGRGLDRAMVWAAEALAGGARVPTVAHELGMSERRLRSRFTEAIGLGPREHVRVDRLNRVVRALASPARPALAELALAAGYCDQAHLSREFKALTGLSPSAYVPAPGAPLHVPKDPRRPRAGVA